MGAARLALLALLAAGCIESESVRCGDVVCPAAYTCLDDSYCASPSQVTACAGLSDGATCSYTGVTAGRCDRGACFATGCGNGIVGEDERCDDGNTTGGDGCSADCLSDETCGNGILDRRTEECDCGTPGDVAADCTGPNGLEPGACRPTCELPRCGDEILDPDEHCETSTVNATCDSLGLYGGTLACSPVCQYDLSGCGRCGDGIVNGPELCDSSSPTGLSCLDYGFDAGRLDCTAACTAAFSGCRKIGWPSVPSPTASDLRDVWGSAPNDIFAVGANGTILHYNGSAWTAMSSGASATLMSVWGTGPADVYAAGSGGTILRWNGTSWMSMNTGTSTASFVGVWAGGGEVFAVATNGVVYHHDGSGWTTATLPMQELPYGIWGSSPDDVWVVGLGGIARYNGTMWSDASMTATEFLNDLTSIWGRGPNDIFVGRIGGRIHHYDGTGWSTSLDLELGVDAASPAFRSLAGTATTDVFASITMSPGTVVIYHFDGDTWTPMRGEPGDLWASGPADVWSVGSAGSIRRFSGWAWMPTAPNGNTQGLWSSGRRGASAGTSVCLFDGTRWRDCLVGAFSDVGGSSLSHVIAVSGGAAKQWNGTAWSDITGLDASTEDFMSVSVTSPSSAFVGASSGRIFEWNGSTWTPHQPASGVSATDVWSAGPGDAWAILGSTPYRLANGTWTPHPAPAGVIALWGDTSASVLAVGSSGVYRWTGSAWMSEQTPPASLLDISGSGPDDIFAVGFGATILHHDGVGWTPIRAPSSTQIRNVAVSPGAVFFSDSTIGSEVFGLLRLSP